MNNRSVPAERDAATHVHDRMNRAADGYSIQQGPIVLGKRDGVISDEAVEAAAREINKQHGYAMPLWDELVRSRDQANRNRVKLDRGYARAALEAAAPYLMRTAWDEGWDAHSSWPGPTKNPYIKKVNQ